MPLYIPAPLESEQYPGYASQESVHAWWAPELTLRAFSDRFPYRARRLPVSYNPLVRRNFYPMILTDQDHRDTPNAPTSHRPSTIRFRASLLKEALDRITTDPDEPIDLRRLYMQYTRNMRPRPPIHQFPKLLPGHLTRAYLLKLTRWPIL